MRSKPFASFEIVGLVAIGTARPSSANSFWDISFALDSNFDCEGIDCAWTDSIVTPEAPTIDAEPITDVFKKLRREDWVIFAPLIFHQCIEES